MSNTIIYFISSLFEIYALGIYSGQLFLPRHSKHTRIILLSVFCLVLFIVGLFQNAWLNITVFACILGIYMFSQYQTIWYICLFHTFLLTAYHRTCKIKLQEYTGYLQKQKLCKYIVPAFMSESYKMSTLFF
jgi:uncharacterized membrane protein